MSSAECLMHGAALASHHASPRPTPPRLTVNVGVGTHSVTVAPSAHATRAGAFGEADVVADGTYTAGSVAATEWLAATLDGVDVNAGGAGARTSVVDDGLCTGLEGCDTSTSPSSYLHIVHDDDVTVDVTPLLSLQKAHGGSNDCRDCDGVDRGVPLTNSRMIKWSMDDMSLSPMHNVGIHRAHCAIQKILSGRNHEKKYFARAKINTLRV